MIRGKPKRGICHYIGKMILRLVDNIHKFPYAIRWELFTLDNLDLGLTKPQVDNDEAGQYVQKLIQGTGLETKRGIFFQDDSQGMKRLNIGHQVRFIIIKYAQFKSLREFL